MASTSSSMKTRRRNVRSTTSSTSTSRVALALLAAAASSSIYQVQAQGSAAQLDDLYGSWSTGFGDVMTGPVSVYSTFIYMYTISLFLSSFPPSTVCSLLHRYPHSRAARSSLLPACLVSLPLQRLRRIERRMESIQTQQRTGGRNHYAIPTANILCVYGTIHAIRYAARRRERLL